MRGPGNEDANSALYQVAIAPGTCSSACLHVLTWRGYVASAAACDSTRAVESAREAKTPTTVLKPARLERATRNGICGVTYGWALQKHDLSRVVLLLLFVFVFFFLIIIYT